MELSDFDVAPLGMAASAVATKKRVAALAVARAETPTG